MSLTDLLLLIKGEDDEVLKHIDLFFDKSGLMILCDTDEELTAHETQYASAVAFIHAGAEIKGIILEPQDAAYLGFKLYHAFHNTYEGMKTIGEMTLEDFNKYLRDHDL